MGASDDAGWGFSAACGDGVGWATGEEIAVGWAVDEDSAGGWPVGARVRYTKYPAPSDTTSARTAANVFFTASACLLTLNDCCPQRGFVPVYGGARPRKDDLT